ncbi:MAG: hypothetical protein KC502_17125 [Myxococcales bacterium]|nr:hypothetical protein [Myxococcales bacterium]
MANGTLRTVGLAGLAVVGFLLIAAPGACGLMLGWSIVFDESNDASFFGSLFDVLPYAVISGVPMVVGAVMLFVAVRLGRKSSKSAADN